MIDRRRFLAVAGLAALGLAGKPVFDALSGLYLTRAAPSGPPVPTRWGMAIDLRSCTAGVGCRECIAACHRAHNVPDFGNPKDEVAWARTVPYENVFGHEPELIPDSLRGLPVLALCNHCANPPCVTVCPTKATWKREDGIVMIDYHRCIGCRYCMAACPFGARSFNWRDPRPFIAGINPDFPARTKGVVEKCNFCEERLAAGEVPACVAACPEKSLTFGNLEEPGSPLREITRSRFTIQRKPELGTAPKVYYVV
ncbi:MAG: 4Fe-4S dicluster domain-containing protein [Chloroflexi bacterium]|nr:4Fe-4S dicluster domain-containing protein [Chloroflexota bacterium]